MLTRSEIQSRFPHLTQERVDVYLQKLSTLAAVVSQVPEGNVPLRDPDDLPYLNLAIAVNASYLVSRDKDLLNLMHEPPFVVQHPNLQIVEPVTFIRAVRSTKPRFD